RGGFRTTSSRFEMYGLGLASKPAARKQELATTNIPREEMEAIARRQAGQEGDKDAPPQASPDGAGPGPSPAATPAFDTLADDRASAESPAAPLEEPATAGADPFIGKTLGGARLERLIGKGGMGSVYRATQLDLERPIAVKILSPALVSSPVQVQQFFREAKALAKLEHANIVTIYSVGKDEDVHFILMQLVEGGSLEGRLRWSGRLSIEQACGFFEQAAKGLEDAHQKGIVHRDVKPENMLVAGEVLKVTDFGLARFMTDLASGFSGQIVGTPWYMSPEQIDGREVDARTDIYALGATFYYLLTGERPFTADTPVEILLKHVNDRLIPPHERRSEVPEALSR
ncbi:MAG: serine/threonine-protein kinase, partial [Polyangiaceae bacterium]